MRLATVMTGLRRRWVFAVAGLALSPVPSTILVATGHAIPNTVWGITAALTAILFGFIGYALGRREEKLVDLGLRDSLTGLWNRAALTDRLEEEIHRSSRSDAPLAMLLVDLDHLKPINDRFGHAAGDEAITRVADCIRAVCRATDIPSRHGGDEFAILAPSADASQAAILAERIRAGVEAFPLKVRGTTIDLSVSIGVADIKPDANLSAAAVLQAADIQLYRAKAAGRNQVVVRNFDGQNRPQLVDNPPSEDRCQTVHGPPQSSWRIRHSSRRLAVVVSRPNHVDNSMRAARG